MTLMNRIKADEGQCCLPGKGDGILSLMLSFSPGAAVRRVFVGVLMGAGVYAPVQGAGQGAPQAATTLVEPPAPLLTEHVGGLAATGILRKDAGELTEGLFDRPGCEVETAVPPMVLVSGSCAEVLKGDGLQRLAAGDFDGPGGKAQVTSFEFGDATGAYSAYTFYRAMMMSGIRRAKVAGPEARLTKAATERTTGPDGTLVWAGTSLLKVTGRVTAEDLNALVTALPKVGGRRGLPPLLPTLLPKEGLEPGSVRYGVAPAGYQAMGGVLPAAMLGWDKSLETATATYNGKRGSVGTLTLLMYPTPQIAGDRGRAIEKAVNDAGGQAKFGMVKMRRVGPLVGMTSGALSAEQAQSLIAGLHLNEEVSFDQKLPLEFHAEVKKTASLLQNIAVLCGVLILAAVLLGLFLGGARAGIRVLMGKPAASEPEFLTLSLQGEPKALFVRKEDVAE